MERIGIIGLGNISARHRRNIRLRFPRATIIATAARTTSRSLQPPIEDVDILTLSVDELLQQQPQCVIVASPASLHYDHAKVCIEAGVPVLIEKPLSATLEDSIALSQLTERAQSQVAVGYCLRFLPSAEVVKNVLTQQRLGTIYNVTIEVGQYLPHWRPNIDYQHSVSAQKKLGGGALLELSHELDLAQWLLGPLTLQHAILRSAAELETDVEDCADLMLLAANQAVTHIHLDFLQRIPQRKWRIIGSLGTLEWDLIRNEVTLKSESAAEVLYSAPDWDKNQMYLLQFEEFMMPKSTDQKKIASVNEALISMRLIEEIKRFPVHTINN